MIDFDLHRVFFRHIDITKTGGFMSSGIPIEVYTIESFVDKTIDEMLDYLINDKKQLYVADYDDKLIGAVFKENCFIEFFEHPDYTNKGVFTKEVMNNNSKHLNTSYEY